VCEYVISSHFHNLVDFISNVKKNTGREVKL
jgi:hypothetical protein